MIDEDDASHSCHEHVPDTTILESKEIVDYNEEGEKDEQVENKEEQIEQVEQNEHKEKSEPPSDTSMSNDKEVSTEVLILQCLKEPSYAKILKDLCRQAHKSRNHRPKKIFPSKQIDFLRWQNILPECYQILKKKWWKGLVGQPHDRGRYGNFYFLFFIFRI